jgi:hypothetical protein
MIVFKVGISYLINPKIVQDINKNFNEINFLIKFWKMYFMEFMLNKICFVWEIIKLDLI